MLFLGNQTFRIQLRLAILIQIDLQTFIRFKKNDMFNK